MSYSSEFNLKKEKCLSCQHYSGCRGVSSGFMGDRIEYEQNGICDKNGSWHPQDTTANSHCYKWKRDSRISLAISKKEQRKAEYEQREIERNQCEENRRQQRALQSQRDEIERERLLLESERKRLEHQKWLNSLSPEEREKVLSEEKRKEEEKENQAIIDRKLSEVQAKLEEVEGIRKKAKKEKRRPLVGCISLIAISLVCFAIGWIPFLSNLFKAKENEMLAHAWVVMMGYSTDSEEYLEWMALAEQFHSRANEFLYLPFLILGICLVLTVFATILLLFRKKKRLEVIEKNFTKNKKEALQLLDEVERITKENMDLIKKSLEQ